MAKNNTQIYFQVRAAARFNYKSTVHHSVLVRSLVATELTEFPNSNLHFDGKDSLVLYNAADGQVKSLSPSLCLREVLRDLLREPVEVQEMYHYENSNNHHVRIHRFIIPETCTVVINESP